MKRKFAFDWGGALENNESLRQIARDLFAAGYEVHIIPACGVEGIFPYCYALAHLNVPYHGLHMVLHTQAELSLPDFAQIIGKRKVEMMRVFGCSVLYDDNPANILAANAAGIEAIQVTKVSIVSRPPELAA